MDGWTSWASNDCGIVKQENSYAKVSYLFADKDQWGNFSSWLIQMAQENIPVEKQKSYDLYFTAASTLERPIKVVFKQDGAEKGQYVELTNEAKQYKLSFDSEGEQLNLMFFLATSGKIRC